MVKLCLLLKFGGFHQKQCNMEIISQYFQKKKKSREDAERFDAVGRFRNPSYGHVGQTPTNHVSSYRA